MRYSGNEQKENTNKTNESFIGLRMPKGYTSLSGNIFLIGSTIISGLVYVLLQWFRHEKIKDALFVSMLIGATMILVYGISYLRKYIINKGINFCVDLLSRSNTEEGFRVYENLCHSVINLPRMTLSGILYGLAIGSSPYILGVWNDDTFLRIFLSIFLFFVNFATGIAFYGLVTFFIQSVKMGRLLNVNLWQVNNPSTDFFLGATRRISVLVSIYVCICISSILKSELPIEKFVIAYACFAGIVVVGSLLIPLLPVVRKLKEAKINALFEIDKQLHLSFHKKLEDIKPNKPNVDFEKVKTLLELREKVGAINTWPFRIKSIMAVASVMFFSAIPVILNIILEKLLG